MSALDLVDQIWLTGPCWPDRVDRPGPFQKCHFSDFSFPELSFFRIWIVNSVLSLIVPVRTCHFSDCFFFFRNCPLQIFLFSEVFFSRCFLCQFSEASFSNGTLLTHLVQKCFPFLIFTLKNCVFFWFSLKPSPFFWIPFSELSCF